MAGGKFFEHLNDTFVIWWDFGRLEQCHITTRYNAARETLDESVYGDTPEECELATLLGKYTLEFAFQKLKRFMWLVRGWLVVAATANRVGRRAPFQVLADIHRVYKAPGRCLVATTALLRVCLSARKVPGECKSRQGLCCMRKSRGNVNPGRSS